MQIADHTHSHKSVKGMPTAQLEKETVGARAELAECGIPEGDILGFRAPYLETDIALRKMLFKNGFLYERCGHVGCAVVWCGVVWYGGGGGPARAMSCRLGRDGTGRHARLHLAVRLA